ncbi:hypothetical protein [Phreatobacter oligotrophus]|uniref:SnoaL-like protein n=1 Tax=Phreatobacter oligotrophus TaxID=1122261 RepID=A0A2T4YZG2_9HYPH|nr:hypothetical protein [Phreatobacter oligotrophus]PTM52366.1 hypothetical protein C8P69_108167 [Phreatobacter oligotrophus]
MWQRLSCGTALTIALIFSISALAQDDDDEARHREAEAFQERVLEQTASLLQAIANSPLVPPGRCAIINEWLPRAVIDRSTARRYLNSTVAADLVGVHVAVWPDGLMDPDQKRSTNFCTREEKAKHFKEMHDAWQHSGDSRLETQEIQFGIPVFDADFSRAAIVIEGRQNTSFRLPDGTTRGGMEVCGGAAIYEKSGGTWQKIAYEQYYCS